MALAPLAARVFEAMLKRKLAGVKDPEALLFWLDQIEREKAKHVDDPVLSAAIEATKAHVERRHQELEAEHAAKLRLSPEHAVNLRAIPGQPVEKRAPVRTVAELAAEIADAAARVEKLEAQDLARGIIAKAARTA